MKRISLKVWTLLSVLFFATPFFILANSTEPLVPCSGLECGPCHIFEMFGRAFDFVVLNIIQPFALIMFIISGIMFFTAIGDSSKLEKSKSIMISTVIGIVLISLAWLITVQIYSIFGADESYTKDWWEICEGS
mgnify:FL=1